MRIVVAGAGGYIGIPLCQELKNNGHEVVALDRFFFEKEPDGCEIARADTRAFDPELLRGADAVFDLAGLSNDASAEIDPELTYSINVMGGRNLATLAQQAGVKRYIYSSSCAVYGNGGDKFLTEKDRTSPLTAYAKSKVMSEDFLREIDRTDFEVVIFRCATVFGVAPRMRFDLAVNVMTMRAHQEKVIYIMGGGDQWRPFVHVANVCDAFVAALEIKPGTYNVGFESLNLVIADLAGCVWRETKATVHRIPDAPDTRSYRVDFSKIKKAIPISRPVKIDAGIGEIIAAIENGDVDPKDPTTITLSWYKSLLAWEERLGRLRMHGRIL